MAKRATIQVIRINNSPCDFCEKARECSRGCLCPVWRGWFRHTWRSIQEESRKKYGIPAAHQQPEVKEQKKEKRMEDNHVDVDPETGAAIYPK